MLEHCARLKFLFLPQPGHSCGKVPAGENFKHKNAKELDKEDAVGVHRQVLGVGAKQLVHKPVVLDQIANVTSPALTFSKIQRETAGITRIAGADCEHCKINPTASKCPHQCRLANSKTQALIARPLQSTKRSCAAAIDRQLRTPLPLTNVGCNPAIKRTCGLSCYAAQIGSRPFSQKVQRSFAAVRFAHA
jgi:hypothetical protein